MSTDELLAQARQVTSADNTAPRTTPARALQQEKHPLDGGQPLSLQLALPPRLLQPSRP